MNSTKAALVIACFFVAGIPHKACAQIDDTLWERLATPKPRVVVLLSEKKASLWDSICSNLSNLDTLRAVARQHDLRMVPPNKENKEATVLIDNILLKPSSQYELEVLNLSIEALLSQKYFVLSDLSKERRESILEWLEQFAPMRFSNIRAFDRRFHEVLFFPIGLVRARVEVADGRLLSGYIEEVYPSEKSDLLFAKELCQQAPENYSALDIEQYKQQIMKHLQQQSEGVTVKVNIFSTGIFQEELNEIVASTLAKYTAEAIEQAQQGRQSIFEQLRDKLRDTCSKRFGSDLCSVSSLKDLPESLKSSIGEMLRSENLNDTSIRGLHIEIRPGVAIGIINKYRNYYTVYKIDLSESRFAGMGDYFLGVISEE